MLLLGRRLVDLHAQRGELEPADLAIDGRRHRVDPRAQLPAAANQLLHAQRLQRERDIHHRGRVTLCGGQVDDPPVSEEVEPATVGEDVLLHQRPDVADPAGRQGRQFAEIELDTETGKFKILTMLTVADCGTVLHPQGLAHQIRGGNVMGIGMARLERHVYDPKLGIPTTVLLYQAKLPGYLDVPAEIGWGAVEMPDPQNPMGVKGVGEPPLGSGAAAITTAISDAMGGYLFNRTPVSTDMILNALSGRPQAHKPLQVNSV